MSYYAYRRPPETILPAGVRESGAEQGPIPEHLLPAKTEAERRERQREAELLREREKRFGKMVPRASASAAKKASPGKPVAAKVEPVSQPVIEADVAEVVTASSRRGASPPARRARVRVRNRGVQLNTWMPEALRERFRLECQRRGVSMGAAVLEALAEWLDGAPADAEPMEPTIAYLREQIDRLLAALLEADGVPDHVTDAYAVVAEHLFGWASCSEPPKIVTARVEAQAAQATPAAVEEARHPLEQLADDARAFGGQNCQAIPGRRDGEDPERYALRVVDRLYAIGARARGRELARKIGEWRRRG